MTTEARDRGRLPAHGSRKILVAEDETLVRMAVAAALRQAGFAVAEAASAHEALALLRADGAIGLVFSDVNMADPLDGFDLLAEVRVRHPRLPVILTSGLTAHEAEASAGGALFLPKPYDPRRVIALARRCLGGSGAGRRD